MPSKEGGNQKTAAGRASLWSGLRPSRRLAQPGGGQLAEVHIERSPDEEEQAATRYRRP